MSRAAGIDVSFWQDDNSTPQGIDFERARAAGAEFVFIKSSQALFTDQDFTRNWQVARAASLLRGAYHFFDYRVSALEQAKYFVELLRGDPGELAPVLDVERHPQWPLPTREALLREIQTFLEYVEAQIGKRPIFYANPAMLYYILKPVPDWLVQYPLWIAHYDVPEPNMIAPWPRWTFWQWTAKGDGLYYGVESKGLDMNWFNGSSAELRSFAGLEPGVEPDPVEAPEILQVTATQLNIRLAPGLDGRDIGDLSRRQLVRRAPGIEDVSKGGITWSPVVVWAARQHLRDV